MDRVFDLASHKGVRVLLEDAHAGLLAKVNPLPLVDRAGVTSRVFQSSAASGFILWFVLSLSYTVVH